MMSIGIEREVEPLVLPIVLNMRLAPRVTTDRKDGWVGKYQGHWYVKIY
jgi:hypothetical protein